MALPELDRHEPTEEPQPEESLQRNEFDPQDPLSSYMNTWKKVMVDPRSFFSAMPLAGGYANPLLFLAINGAVSGLLGGLVSQQTFAGIIFVPAAAAIGSFIGAAILHLFALVFASPVSGGYEASWRVVAYSSAIMLISWIPFVGALVALYSVYIQIMGIEQVHATSTGRAIAIVLSPLILAILLIVVSILSIGFTLLS